MKNSSDYKSNEHKSSNTNPQTSGLPDNTPIIIGAGQSVYRGTLADFDLPGVPTVSLAAQAAERAMADTGLAAGVRKSLDLLVCTRLYADSSPFLSHAFGACENFPASVAKALSLTPKRMVYADTGGQSPQRLINEAAESVFTGKTDMALLVGAEAMDLIKQAARAGEVPDWSEPMAKEFASIDYEDRGYGKPFGGNLEAHNGIALPTSVYALLENAWKHEQDLSVNEHRKVMAELFHRFSKVAANNPYAQFPEEKMSDFLATSSDKNFDITSPYLKWLVAQDAVNQGAAVILTSVGKAKALGVSEDKWVYLRGYGDADDGLITKRESITKAPAVKLAAQTALEMADCGIENIDRFDIYSCFPCAVIFACEAMDIDWQNEQQELTLTGGLPFFGGPGNNYSLHAIAEMVTCLRENKEQLGLIFANGGYLSKASVGIYSAEAPNQWLPSGIGTQLTATANDLNETPLDASVIAEIESYTVTYKRGEPVFANLVATTETGQRLAARLAADQKEFMLALDSADLIGSAVRVFPAEMGNYCEQP